MTQNTSLSYRDAGVDIDAGDALVDRIKPMAKKTLRDGVLGGIGGFGALFEVPKRYKEPVLVSGTDGVGSASFPAAGSVSGAGWRSGDSFPTCIDTSAVWTEAPAVFGAFPAVFAV